MRGATRVFLLATLGLLAGVFVPRAASLPATPTPSAASALPTRSTRVALQDGAPDPADLQERPVAADASGAAERAGAADPSGAPDPSEAAGTPGAGPTLTERVAAAAPALGDVRAELAAIGDAQDPGLVERRARLERIEALLAAAAEARAERDRDRAAAAEAPAAATVLEERLSAPLDTAPPAPAAPPNLAEAEQEAADAQSRLEALRARLTDLDRELELRDAALASLPDELSAAGLRVDEAEQAFLAAERSAEGVDPLRVRELAAGAQAARAAEERLVARRERLIATERPLVLERALLERQLARADVELRFWADEADRLERERSRAAADAAQASAAALRDEYPTLAELQDGTQALLEQLGAIEHQEARRQVERVRQLADELLTRAGTTRLKVSVGGLTQGIGRLLRSEYDWLQSIEPEVRAARRVREQNSLDQIRLEQVKADLRAFADRRATVATLAQEAVPDDLERRAAFEARALPVVEQRFEALGDLRTALREQTLLQVEQLEQLEALEALYDEYRDFVAGEILWVPSTVGGRGLDPGGLGDAFLWLIDPDQWRAAGATLLRRASDSALGTALAAALVLAGYGVRRPLRRRVRTLGEQVRSYRTDTFALTLRALVLTVAIALPLTLTLLLVAELGHDAGSTAPLLDALAQGLRRMAPVAFALSFLRALSMKSGVGEVHFRWSPKALGLLRPHLAALETVVLPAGVLFHLFEATGLPAWNDTLGRLAFVVAMGALVLFSWRVLRPDRGVLAEAFARNPDTLLYRTRKAWFAAAVGLPAAHLLLAVLAYYYTAQQLEQRLEQSLALTLGLVVVNGLLVRWLFVVRRRLAVEQARKRAQERTREGPEDRVSEAGIKLVDEDEVDIPALDAQTRRLFKSGITLTALFGLYLIWSSVLPALGGLDRVQIWPSVEIVESERFGALDALTDALRRRAEPAAETVAPGAEGSTASATDGDSATGGSGFALPGSALLGRGPDSGSAAGTSTATAEPVVTLADVALALIFLLVATVTARNVPALLEISILQRLPIDGGERYAISTLVRYAILIVGASSAFGALGVGWDKIQWLAAALTFGLAFGLQEIFANFVSGIIILLERPVRIGDIVTVAGTEGTVTKLRMRATTVMDWDRRELLVPNKEFITGSIVNWSLSDSVTRIHVDVGVAYGSDVELALRLLRQVAEDCPHVLEEPAPRAWFRHFGDSALILRLLSFIPNRDVYFPALDHQHREIDRLFREHGIEIAFPQRDLHLRSAPALERLARERSRPSDAGPDRGSAAGPGAPGNTAPGSTPPPATEGPRGGS